METDRTMTRAEIDAAFEGEWVLINDPEVDDRLEVVRGRVVHHSADRSESDEAVTRLRSKDFAVQFVGHPDDETRFFL